MLRGAFVGFGNVAANGHAPGWRARRDVAIVAATDLAAERQASFQEIFPDAKWYGDVGALVAEEDLDFVDICTPPGSHSDSIRRALDAGLHVLCEKPLVTRLDQLDTVSRRAKAVRRIVETVHNWTQAPVIRAIADHLDSGTVGPVHHIEWETLRTQPAVAVATEGAVNWRVDPKAAGGGILFDHGWHAFYCICRLMGGEPHGIRATLERRKFHDLPLDDTVEAELLFGTGSARLFLTWAADRRESRLRLEGGKARLWTEGADLHLESGPNRRVSRHSPDLSEGSHHEDWFAGVADNFVDAVTRCDGGYGTEGNLAEAALCMRLIAAAQASHAAGGALVPVSAAGERPLPHRTISVRRFEILP